LLDASFEKRSGDRSHHFRVGVSRLLDALGPDGHATRDLCMIRSHGNVSLSGHDHPPVLGDLCLLRLRLDGGEKKGRRRDKSHAPRGDLRSRDFDNLRHGHDDLRACRP